MINFLLVSVLLLGVFLKLFLSWWSSRVQERRDPYRAAGLKPDQKRVS